MIVIHGNNQQKSRDYFLNRKHAAAARGDEIINLDGQSITYEQFTNSVNSSSLFSKTGIYFIEHLISRRPGKDKEKILNHLKSSPDLQVFVWEGKDVGTQLKGYPSSMIVKFDHPKYIFDFLNSLQPAALAQTLKYSAPEQLFSMLVKQFHDLIIFKSAPENKQPGVSYRIKNLSRQFSLPQLLAAYQQLLQIDSHQKQSASAFDLASALTVWLNRLQIHTKKM